MIGNWVFVWLGQSRDNSKLMHGVFHRHLNGSLIICIALDSRGGGTAFLKGGA